MNTIAKPGNDSRAGIFTAEQGIEYTAEFVPFSQSRNAGDKTPSLNWRVTLRKGGTSITTDYMQGIGYLPGYDFSNRLAVYADRVKEACETGRSVFKIWPHQLGRPINPPPLTDVLYALVMDADAIEYGSFEEWAEALGYDTDSREAERIYNQCLQIGLKLRQIVDLDAAREAFQDY